MVAGWMTRKREFLARSILVVLLVTLAVVMFVAWRSTRSVTLLRARMPELGGWAPINLRARVGEPLRLRLTSDDVTHSFAVGKMDWEAVDIYAGEFSEITLNFDQPGKYTFYCTRWCGVNHWRMRGTIDVSGDGDLFSAQAPAALYMQLGLDIDAEHHAEIVPPRRPSTGRGADLAAGLAEQFLSPEYYRSHSPVEVWQDLRAQDSLAGLAEAEVWDLVAHIWAAQTKPQDLEAGRELYRLNCAACHGESGGGDGVYSSLLDAGSGSMDGHNTTAPASFSDPEHMLGAAPAVLHGKIVRGGMGTGMPYWGPIFSDEQTWQVVSYLWGFQFDFDMEVEE